jgi:hypothetical protein
MSRADRATRRGANAEPASHAHPLRHRWLAAASALALLGLGAACGGSKGSDPIVEPDTTPPSVPTGLAASNPTASSLTLCWSASTDDVGVAGYTVTRDDGLVVATSASTCADIGGLSPSLSYTFTVRARDAAGNTSAASAPFSATSGAGVDPCPAPAMPAFSDLPSNAKLPDPFRRVNGGRLTRADQWSCRRSELAAMAAKWELGARPGAPASESAVFHADTNTLTVTVTVGANTVSFDATIIYPTTGTPPYPAMIELGTYPGSLGEPALNALGVAVVRFDNSGFAAQTDGSSRGQGLFYQLHGASHPAGALMAWSWGISRLIDALAQTPEAGIDATRLGVTGCSRNGKGALVAGAFDERIALTIPQESGSGGAASWRVSEAQNAASPGSVQTLSEIVGENVWFTPGFASFSSAVDKLPFDHHEVAALVAPRPLFIIENTDMIWLGNVSTFSNATAARKVWQALALTDRMGYSQVGGHNHCALPASQAPEVAAFVTRFLLNGTADTSIFHTDGGFAFDGARWVDWTVPTLQ